MTKALDPFSEEAIDLELAALLAERERTMHDFTPDHRPLVIYAVIRRDLEMKPGKLSSQTGHAYGEAIEHTPPELLAQYKGTGHGIKRSMSVRNLGQLKRAYREAKQKGIPCYWVIDRNHEDLPHFTGKPVTVGIALGPVYKDVAEPITKRMTSV